MAICQFCDTDFVGTDGELGGKFKQARELVAIIDGLWPTHHPQKKYVVFTGGEPLMQLDAALIDAMHAAGFEIAIETNGTIAVPEGVDWICVSPKIGAELIVMQGDELKVVIPQLGQNMQDYTRLDFKHFYVQAMDGPLQAENLRKAVDFCKNNPAWKLSLQTHKLLNIP